MTGKRPPMPSKMGSEAKRIWNAVVDAFDLRADKLRILKDICREVDITNRIERELASAPTMVKGSMGQDIINPLFTEARQHSLAIAALFKSLNLDGLKATGAGSKNAAKAGNVIDMANKWKQAK